MGSLHARGERSACMVRGDADGGNFQDGRKLIAEST